ncbi:MAG: PAS domain S-box protein [Candidatus Aminicenantales bacterium]
MGTKMLTRSAQPKMKSTRLQRIIDFDKALLSFYPRPLNTYILHLDKNCIIIYKSPSVGKFLGYGPKDLLGWPFQEFVHPEERNSLRKKLHSIGRSAGGFHSERFRFKHKDGSWRILQCVCTNALNNRSIKGILVNAVDITEWKKAHQGDIFKERELESSINAVAIADLNNHVVHVNDSFLSLWGYEKEEDVLGRHVVDFWENKKKTIGSIEKLNERGSWTGEMTAKRKDGSVFECSVFGQIVKDGKEKPFGKMAFFLDITELKKAKERLKREEKRFESLILNSSDIIMVLDAQGNATYISPSVKSILGFAPKEMIGKNAFDYMHPKDVNFVFKKFQNDLPKSGVLTPVECRIRSKLGSWVNFEVIANNLFSNPYIQGMIINARDITARKKLEEQLKSSRDKLRGLALRLQALREEERKALAREIHDELGANLTVAKIDLDWAIRKLDTPQKGHLEKLRSIGKSLDCCIDNLQRIVSELRPPLLEDVGLIPAIKSETQAFQKRTGIKCHVSADPVLKDLKNFPRDYKVALFRIFQEGLTNIALHAKATKTEIALAKKNGFLILTIQDNGKGIQKEQISSSTSFGLIGMRERVVPWGGNVEIKRIPQDGTRVTIRLPMR